MSIQEQRRKAFEEAASKYQSDNNLAPADFSTFDGQYLVPALNAAWWAWNAALDSVVIELPNQLHAKPYVCYEGGWNDALLETSGLIEGMGLKVKP